MLFNVFHLESSFFGLVVYVSADYTDIYTVLLAVLTVYNIFTVLNCVTIKLFYRKTFL